MVSFPAAAAAAVPVTLGQKDFNDGQLVDFDNFNSQSAGEPSPFDGFRGSDVTGQAFSAVWTFAFGVEPFSSGSVTIGMFDHDSAAPGSQVLSFTVDGSDLTAGLNALFEAHGGTQAEYDIYTLNLPPSTFPAFADGSATFSLTLQGPGLQGTGGTTNQTIGGNGAGIDFSTLNLPEPGGVALAALAAAAFPLKRRRRP